MQLAYDRALSPAPAGPDFGQRELACARVTSAWCAPWTVLGPHAHDRPVVAVTLAGSCEVVTGTGTTMVPLGWVHVSPPSERHSYRCLGAGAHLLILEADPSRHRTDTVGPVPSKWAEAFEDWSVHAQARRVADECTGPPDEVTGAGFEAMTLELLTLVERRGIHPARSLAPAWFARVRDRLHQEFRRPPSRAALAATAGVHPAYLAERFRDLTGLPIGAYLRRLRLAWCIHQVCRGDLTLSEIAFQAGFADQSHFTRTFSRHVGVPPGHYRATHAPAQVA